MYIRNKHCYLAQTACSQAPTRISPCASKLVERSKPSHGRRYTCPSRGWQKTPHDRHLIGDVLGTLNRVTADHTVRL